MRVTPESRSRWTSVLPIAWFLILIAPAALTLSAWQPWDLDPTQVLVASAWLIVLLRLLLPPGAFLWVTYPVALFGLACLAADFLRDVNLLELVAEWNTFSRADVADAVAPYRGRMLAAAAGLAVLGWMTARSTGPHGVPARVRHLVAAAGTGVLVLLFPLATWPRAWPINATLIGAAFVTNSPVMAHQSSSVMLASPRNPNASWGATRAAAAAGPRVTVLLVGESVRADFMRECGGPASVRAVHAGGLVACDMTAGADATHASVPLLVSREWPGHATRVSDDASFQHALAETGFHTWWFGSQEGSIAWPDAATQAFVADPDPDRLLPLLEGALDSSDTASSIVLHTYGAHTPYCQRFHTRQAPAAVGCPLSLDGPTRADIAQWRIAYAHAVDASVDFLNRVIDRLERAPGEVFLVYTPDHGDNLLDDDRELFGHALRHPTVWDSHVPAVFWANAAWKAAHPAQWAQLQANVQAPLMHADVVPTLLGAAQVRYQDTQRPAVDLLAHAVPQRRRVVQSALGAAVAWDALVSEAAEHRPSPGSAQAAR
jgi:glucan phosphoethanolaminetransferase (alkaline phosphatase superfamily)